MDSQACLFYDGQSAKSTAVKLKIGDNSLVIYNEASGEQIADWLYKKMVRVSTKGITPVRFKVKTDPDARLVIKDRQILNQLEAASARLFGQYDMRKMVVWGSLFLALSIAFVYIVYTYTPIVSRLIANRVTPEQERLISGQSLELITRLWEPCDIPEEVQTSIDDLTDRLLPADSRWNEINVMFVDAPIINAFALPGGYILFTDEIIEFMESPDEFAGVLAHELGHVERRHVLQNLIQRTGLIVAIETVTGSSGLGTAIATGTEIVSITYTRRLEEEADAFALDQLRAAGINTNGFANLFERLEDEYGSFELPEWLSSHPASQKRATRAIQYQDTAAQPAMTDMAWQHIKTTCGMDNSDQETLTPEQ